MPPSQLKRLKATLREQGITGPQKSKKQKKNAAKPEQRIQRNAALSSIRESFNLFDIKAPTRPKKHDVTSAKTLAGKPVKGEVGRPGVTKSMGEETRRRTLLLEMQRRNKTGGIVDRRIGENDPTMTPEQKLLERFTKEKQRRKGASLFDLEGDEEDVQLTHGGRSIDFDGDAVGVDDFDAGSLQGSSDDGADHLFTKKRVRNAESDDDAIAEEPEQPLRKKTKKEVMEEVIAKSKLHKYERQQAKEEDEGLREALDKDMPDILAALMGHRRPPARPPAATGGTNDFAMNPERAALMSNPDKEYDVRLNQMKSDKRAKPTERTKTEEERVQEEAAKLKELEETRLRRMKGEEESDEDKVPDTAEPFEEQEEDADDDEIEADDAAEFGFSAPQAGTRPPGVDDEDDFLMDDDLIASGSDIDLESDQEEVSEHEAESNNEEDEFVADLLSKEERDKPEFQNLDSSDVPFTYECPRTHADFLQIILEVPTSGIPTVVQRIRALYHPQLQADNKAKLADFSTVLVDHISRMVCQKPAPPLAVVESLIRHIHSLSRTYPETIAKAFRSHLQALQENKTPTQGDLVVLTAIGTIYPTSDHFHQVVTPAITLMARWLGMTTPQGPADLVTGAYVAALCLKYQSFSKRYIPEVVRFTLVALSSKPPTEILAAHLANLSTMLDLWASKPSFIEIFTPFLTPIKALPKSPLRTRLTLLLHQATLARRPLELHHHRPLPIKTAIPKFEDNFNPDKHYDPDQDRRDASKLRAEYKKERKGAMRELRKDANFIAREKLREKKETDRAYETKYKRLVAEIQGEEGHEKNVYEREKKMRKGGR